MKQLLVEYRPIKWLRLKKKGEVPQNWGDIKPDQLIAIAALYKQRIGDIGFLEKMTGISQRTLKKLSDFERYKLFESFDFISDNRPYHEFIIHNFWVKEQQFVAPNPKLKAMSFAQFIFADTYFADYSESGTPDDLTKFIASLYLPGGGTFEEEEIDSRSKLFASLHPDTAEAIAINYQLLREWLALAYPLIFQKHEQTTADEPGAKRDRNIWVKIFNNFVGDDILHDEEWARKPINTIFTFMTRRYKENARRPRGHAN